MKTKRLPKETDIDGKDVVLGRGTTYAAAWVTVGNLSLHLIKAHEGVRVDVYPLGQETDDHLCCLFHPYPKSP